MAAKKSNSASRKRDLFQLKLPANSENLDIIRKFISGIASNIGFTEEDIYQIELAVDEACANVIKHAYKKPNQDTKNQTIFVTVRKKTDRIEISIADKGVGFNPGELKSPDMDEYLKRMKPGGLGIHLIKTLMDKVTFHINPGVRNEVNMVKKLPQQSAS